MSNCILFILCIFFPPLAVLIHTGCTIDFCINILLTLFGFLPGVAHAIFVVFYYAPDPDRGLL